MGRRRNIWNFTALFVIFLLYVYGTEGNSADLLAKSLTRTSMDLYQLLKKGGENMIFSPLSLQMAMALAYAGAKGNTAKEIEDTYKFPNRNETLNGYLQIIQKLTAPELKIANKMYVDESLILEKSYEEDVKNYLFSKIGKVSFKNSKKSVTEINKWVALKTNNKIQNILNTDLNPETRLVLINAIYFKDDWKYPFNEKLTSLFKFHISKDQSVYVDMMTNSKEFFYLHSEELKAKILAMPYDNNKFEMVIILPDEIDGLEQVEENLTKTDLVAILKTLTEDEIDVRLPKFRIESTFKTLKDTLVKLGIKDLFTNADLSGISTEPLVVNKIIQKAFVEVNEKGSEAAAVTALEFVYMSARLYQNKVFVADHPFMYIIKQGDVILFQGRYVKP